VFDAFPGLKGFSAEIQHGHGVISDDVRRKANSAIRESIAGNFFLSMRLDEENVG